MGYQYKNEIFVTELADGYSDEILNEVKEVYTKAKILNKITNIVKTGRILEDFGDSEVTLLAIEHELNYILED